MQKCTKILKIFWDKCPVGGNRLWSENGDESQMGDQPNFCQLGEPPSPPQKKTLGWSIIFNIRSISVPPKVAPGLAPLSYATGATPDLATDQYTR